MAYTFMGGGGGVDGDDDDDVDELTHFSVTQPVKKEFSSKRCVAIRYCT
jgi:hypothetical protein